MFPIARRLAAGTLGLGLVWSELLRMEALIATVRIFVFASHDVAAVKRYCCRFLRLEHGHAHEIDASAL
jgi:ABC-type Na+ transport system ATPase subunit NatA